jgi:hypothetical protein
VAREADPAHTENKKGKDIKYILLMKCKVVSFMKYDNLLFKCLKKGLGQNKNNHFLTLKTAFINPLPAAI